MIITLAVFYLVKPNVSIYYVCSFVSGALLGGCFNMLAANELLSITCSSKEQVSFMATLSMACGNILVGVVEIIIGVVLDIKNDPMGEQKLFLILIVDGAIALGVLFWRIRLLGVKQKKETDAK